MTGISSFLFQRWAAVFLVLFSVVLPLDGFAKEENNPADSATILQQFSQAARQGDPVAQTNLGSIYLNGVGVRRDFTRAFYWFQQAANQGEGLAQFNLGVLYQEGRGVELDVRKAVDWFKKVELQPNRGEQFNPAIKGWAELKLGFIYYEGRGVPKDYKEALSWFQKAAERGLVIAQEMLGRMYDEAQGSVRDEKRAFMWYEKAARQGSSIAEKALERLSKKLTPQQKTAARQWEPKPPAAVSSEPLPLEVSASTLPPSSQRPMPEEPTPQKPQTAASVVAHKEAAMGAKPVLVGGGVPSISKPQETLFPLTIVPEPADAHVQIMNILPRYQPGILLKPGTYTIKVSHPDFASKRFKMALNRGNTETTVALAKTEKPQKPGVNVAGSQSRVLCDLADEYTLPLPRHHVLTVQSNPGNAQVKILNIKPAYRHGISLPAGFYHMQVSKEAFETKQCWAEIKDGELLLDIPLKPLAPGDLFALTINPQPADAHVQLLYTDIPYRPGVLLTPGSYQVEVSKKGYKTEKIPLTLQRENLEIPVVLTELTLNARPTLTVVPVLKKATIRIVNATVPYHPGLPLVPGKYLVEVAKPGFKTQQRWVELSEQDLRIEIEMEDQDVK